MRAHAHAPSWATHGSTHALAGASIRGANESLYFIALAPNDPRIRLGQGRALSEYDGLTPSMMAMLLLNGCAAYLVNLSNFLVTKYTSALTLQVLGNAKVRPCL